MRGAGEVLRDAEGRLVLGDPRAVCPHCGAAAVVDVSANGLVAYWHLPTACCAARRSRQVAPTSGGLAPEPGRVIPTEVRDWWND